MAQATDLRTTSRFHNLSNAALADALGHADAVLKGAEVECKALKNEIKRRGLLRPPATASPSGPIPCLQAVCPRFRSRERLCRWRDREPFYMQATLSF
jgi:hypothetical protein